MNAKTRRGVGESDALVAHQFAAIMLGVPEEKLRRPPLGEGSARGHGSW